MTHAVSSETTPAVDSTSPLEVARVSLKLGLTSFGGPIAHLGYYREEYVLKRRWLKARRGSGLPSRQAQFL